MFYVILDRHTFHVTVEMASLMLVSQWVLQMLPLLILLLFVTVAADGPAAAVVEDVSTNGKHLSQ